MFIETLINRNQEQPNYIAAFSKKTAWQFPERFISTLKMIPIFQIYALGAIVVSIEIKIPSPSLCQRHQSLPSIKKSSNANEFKYQNSMNFYRKIKPNELKSELWLGSGLKSTNDESCCWREVDARKQGLELYNFYHSHMSDEEKAITHLHTQPYSLQEKLSKIKITNPFTGETHSWQQSQYIKSLARKIHQKLELINTQ